MTDLDPQRYWPMDPSEIDYDRIDPGVRRLVRLLNENGIPTCDSGDGVSKGPDYECMIPVPHVIAQPEGDEQEQLLNGYAMAHKIAALLPTRTRPEQQIQVTYSAYDDVSVVEVYGYSDEDLP